MRAYIRRSRAARLAPLALLLLLAGCANVNMTNTSTQYPVTLEVGLPDRASPMLLTLGADSSTARISASGGPFLVTALPNETVRQNLRDLRDIYQRVLTTPDLTPAEIAATQKGLDNLLHKLALAAASGATCGGNLSDWGSLTITASWDTAGATWRLGCAVKAGEPPNLFPPSEP